MQSLEEIRRLRAWNSVRDKVHRRRIEDNKTIHNPRPLPIWFGFAHDNKDVITTLIICCAVFVFIYLAG